MRNFDKLKLFIDYQKAKVCKSFSEFEELQINRVSMHDAIKLVENGIESIFYFYNVKFNYSMIFSDKNEIIE